MKHLMHCLILSACILLSTGIRPCQAAAPPPPSLPESWTLAEAVNYAIENNPDIHIAMQRLASSAAMADSARAYTMPSVTLTAEYSQTNTPMYSFGNILNQGAFDTSIDFNDPGRTDNMLLQAMVKYRLYDGGQTAAGVEKADAEKRAVASQLDVVHQQLAFEVVRTYYSILQAEEMFAVRDAAVKSIEASLEVGKARYEAGDLLKEDLLNLELQQSREMENRIRSHHEYDLAQKIFWNLLGSKTDQPEKLPQHLAEQNIPQTFDISARKELITITERIVSAEATLEGARSGERPAVDTFAQYQYEQGTVLGESGNSWLAGVQLNYSLYDGHRTEAEVAKAKAQIAEMKAMKAQLELALSLELQRAQIAYQQSLERLQVTAKMVQVATESAKLSRIRFQEGVILASDLIDMEMRLTDAQARRASAKAENSIAIANLRRANGLDQFEESH